MLMDHQLSSGPDRKGVTRPSRAGVDIQTVTNDMTHSAHGRRGNQATINQEGSHRATRD